MPENKKNISLVDIINWLNILSKIKVTYYTMTILFLKKKKKRKIKKNYTLQCINLT